MINGRYSNLIYSFDTLDRSIIIAQITNSLLALPTPIKRSKRVLSSKEAISPTKVEK